ncbi:MAG: flagellar filament capping protein FliD [bacterium]
MSVSFGGLSSGLDTDQIVNSLLQIEARPIKRYEDRIENATKTQDAFRDLNNRVSSLLSKVDALGDTDSYEKMKLNVSDTDVLTASISDDSEAVAGDYDIFVESLATKASTRSGRQINDQKMYTSDGETSISNSRVSEGTGGLSTSDSLSEALDELENNVELTDAGTDDFTITIKPYGTVEEDQTIGIDIQQFMDDNPDATLQDFIDHVNDEIVAANPNGIQRLKFDYDKSKDRFSFVPSDQRGDPDDPVSVDTGGSTFELDYTPGDFTNGDHSFLRAVEIMESGSAHNFTQRPSEQTDPENLMAVDSGVKLENALFTNKVSGTGELRINSTTISYDAADDSLQSVIKKINDNVDGVTASFNSLTDRITLRDEQTGAGEIEVEDVSGNLGSALNLLDSSTTGQEEGEYTAGTDAEVNVDGIKATADGNKLNFEGIEIDLKSLHTEADNPDDPVTITVSEDLESSTKKVASFVDQFNSVIEFINKKSEVIPATEPGEESETGPLSSDSTSRNLRTQLISMVTDRYNKAVGSESSLYSMADLGIEQVDPSAVSAKDVGKITFNHDTFRSALSDDKDNVIKMFNASTEDGDEADGFATRLSPYLEDMTNSTDGLIATRIEGFDTTIMNLEDRIIRQEEHIDNRRTVLERQFRQMESMLAELQSQQGALQQQM